MITTKNVVKYLGLWLDTKLVFREQIKVVSEKAANVALQLNRLMVNVGGAAASKCQLLKSVTHFILLYRYRSFCIDLTTHSQIRELEEKKKGSAEKRTFTDGKLLS